MAANVQTHIVKRKNNAQLMLPVFFVDDTTGSAKTALDKDSFSKVSYYRQGDTSDTAITLVDGVTVGTWLSSAIEEIDATNAPGLYTFSVPNAVVQYGRGVDWAAIVFTGAVGTEDVMLHLDLVRSVAR